MVWIKFVICVLVIFLSGKQVAKYGDIIAERTGLGGVWIGVILISAITSLPELFNGISAVTLVKAPDLTVGNLLGANSFNLMNLAILDIWHRNNSLLANASTTHRLTAWLSIGIVSLVTASLALSHYVSPLAIGWIGIYTPVIILFYLFSIRKIFRVERELYTAEAEIYRAESSTRRVCFYFVIAAIFIIGAGVWLATIGAEISQLTGLNQSFVGSLFLAFTTTLPEITVSYTAMRLGAMDMAVANMIGSNLFNMTIISVGDLLYLQGPILANVSPNHITTGAAVILMTLLFIFGLHRKPKRFLHLSWWNLLTILLFLISAYANFIHA